MPERRPILLALLPLVLACGAPQTNAAGTTGLLDAGDEAPDFVAADQTGEVRQLRMLRRGGPAVLFFYPRDGTPGCTEEACAFRDAWQRLQDAGAVVIGVSTDDVASHARFAEEHELPFTLLSDPAGEILARYGVPSRMGMAARVTFVIGPDGRVARVFEDVDPAVHVDEVVDALRALPPPTEP
ncbi:MAG TPA: peroxiredoxin [Sandaracinaceae bacterium LLY-WYZ-13_1]|nr:peroxiredoxin [Sandaracinaceae bacterium LLY-WYZ-13_1]